MLKGESQHNSESTTARTYDRSCVIKLPSIVMFCFVLCAIGCETEPTLSIGT